MDSPTSKPHLGVARIVMPMFGFVLAYNLARPGALAKGVHRRMLCRLTLAGLAASPMFIYSEWHVRHHECVAALEHFIHATACRVAYVPDRSWRR
jgi:hypothetical protein